MTRIWKELSTFHLDCTFPVISRTLKLRHFFFVKRNFEFWVNGYVENQIPLILFTQHMVNKFVKCCLVNPKFCKLLTNHFPRSMEVFGMYCNGMVSNERVSSVGCVVNFHRISCEYDNRINGSNRVSNLGLRVHSSTRPQKVIQVQESVHKSA